MRPMYTTRNNTRCAYCGTTPPHTPLECKRLLECASAGDIYAKKVLNKAKGLKKICGGCGDAGHFSTQCPVKFAAKRKYILEKRANLDAAFIWLHEIGFGPGCMLNGMAKDWRWASTPKGEKMVVIEDFSSGVFNKFLDEMIGTGPKNWYMVKAVDTTNETVSRIYLPYHKYYAPTPTSKKVEVVHKAKPEELEKLKGFVDAYTDPILSHGTLESYLKAGHRMN